MKKTNLLTAAILCMAIGFTSCSDSHVDDLCSGCHLEATIIEMHFEGDYDANGDSIFEEHAEIEIWDIENPSGGSDFCGDDLLNAEAPDNVVTITEPLIGDFYGEILPAGEYGPGVDTIYLIHCEEHADDDHDH